MWLRRKSIMTNQAQVSAKSQVFITLWGIPPENRSMPLTTSFDSIRRHTDRLDRGRRLHPTFESNDQVGEEATGAPIQMIWAVRFVEHLCANRQRCSQARPLVRA